MGKPVISGRGVHDLGDAGRGASASPACLPAGRRRALLGDAADDVFATFADRVLPFDAVAAGHYADVVVEREHAGAPMTGFDAQIAAICRVHRAGLATRNIDDFDRLGLIS